MHRKALILVIILFWTTPLLAGTISAAQQAQKAIVSIYAYRQVEDNDGQQGLLTQKGAGVILDQTGIIVTNFHTIQSTRRIKVKLFDGKTYPARIERVMPTGDLALLKIIPQQTLFPIDFADARSIRLHTHIIHAGHSFWLKGTLSGGRIVGLGKSKSTNELGIFEVNLDLYKGDSGGPVLNKQGQLLGMMIAKRTDRHKSSYAIPSHLIKKFYYTYQQQR